VNPPDTEFEFSDLQYCWQMVRRVQPMFLISSPYLPKQQVEGVLALFALCASIEEVLFKVTDESVARTKLTWWAEELLPAAMGNSDHPIVRQLHRSGAISPCVHGALQRLIQTSLDRICAEPPANPTELRTLCSQVGLYPMQMELGFTSQNDEGGISEAACAVNGLVQLLREDSRRQKHTYQWLPMNLVARNGISHRELGEDGRSMSEMQLINEVCQLGESWSVDSLDLAVREEPESPVTAAWLRSPEYRHCYILAKLNLRLLGRLKKIKPENQTRAFDTVTLADSWHAWRNARRWATQSSTV
jgi:phytoene/squalene synthetase